MTAPGSIPRLAIFASHPTQYQAPVFRALSARADVDPTVFFGSDHGVRQTFDSGFGRAVQWDIPLLGGYRHQFLLNKAARPDVNSFTGISVPMVRSRLTTGNFDAALILGWQTRGHMQALFAAHRAGIPILLLGDSTLRKEIPGTWPTNWQRLLWLGMRKRLYASLLRRVDTVLTVGSRNEEYFRSFNVPDSRMVRVGHAVDNARFSLTADEVAIARREIRNRLGLGDSGFIFISVAKLQEKKRPLDTLKGFAEVATEFPGAALAFVGDGPLREELATAVESHELKERVRIVGFVNQTELPRWYAAADCMVLPSDSRETWGLAVNEALASGMAVIVSDAVGCAPDLVIDGKNGKVFPLGDIARLSDAMRWALCLSGEERSVVSRHAVAAVSSESPGSVAERIATAVRNLVDGT